MKIKINFKADEPTVNGRIYPKEVLKKAFENRLKSSLFVTKEFRNDTTGIPVEDIIGEVKDYEINEENEKTILHYHRIHILLMFPTVFRR